MKGKGQYKENACHRRHRDGFPGKVCRVSVSPHHLSLVRALPKMRPASFGGLQITADFTLHSLHYGTSVTGAMAKPLVILVTMCSGLVSLDFHCLELGLFVWLCGLEPHERHHSSNREPPESIRSPLFSSLLSPPSVLKQSLTMSSRLSLNSQCSPG